MVIYLFTQKKFGDISIIYHGKQTKFKLKMTGISSDYCSILSTYQERAIHLILKSYRHFLNMIQKIDYLPKFSYKFWVFAYFTLK